MEVSGFHIEVEPSGASPEDRERYDIYLSRENFKELTNPKYWRGGYFGSRSFYDNVDFTYFGD